MKWSKYQEMTKAKRKPTERTNGSIIAVLLLGMYVVAFTVVTMIWIIREGSR